MKLAEMILLRTIAFPACFLLLTSQAAVDPGAVDGAQFQPAYSLSESLEHHRNLIRDHIWWTVTGREMAWMHKNAHSLFRTVTVYRNGPVRMLESESSAEIAGFPVPTPDGDIPLEAFIASGHSTAMRVVVVQGGRIVFVRYPRMRDYVHPDGTLFKGGWGGLGLDVNPAQDPVVVFASYFKDDDHREMDLGEAVLGMLHGVYGLAAPLAPP
ncbi:MAG: hypothetical protein OXP09_06645 [Gammaproteobacteria bacterium]|nr:hypothetical protein [Gammaproteobacteria bacterium]MDE0365238.1 hypothetical protein [Gammaproteobacteria bacterium]